MDIKFFMEKSKDNYHVLKVINNNKQVYIGSKYNMENYLKRFIKDIESVADENSVLLILGIGSCEELKELRKRYLNNKIIILEPIQDLVKYIYDKNMMQFDNDNKLFIRFIKDKESVFCILKGLLEEYEVGKIVFRCLYNYDKIFKKELIYINDAIKKNLIGKTIDGNTNLYFAQRWFDTMISNLQYMIKSSSISGLKDSLKNIPAVIVSAGPSLEKNIKKLHQIKNNMFILSGGRTLKSLTEENLTPDILGVVDAGKESYDLVKGYIEKTKVPLLFYEGTNEEIVKRHKGKKMFFTKAEFIKKCFENENLNLVMGGSIAHLLTTFSIYAGCNPIIFIGQDLAYTNEKFHADIAVNQFKNKDQNNVKDNNYLYVKDINGEMIKTSMVLDSFRRDMEFIIKQYPKTDFINATEGGANIEGTINMTLSEAITKYKLNDKIEFNISNNENYMVIQKKFVDILKDSLHACDKIKIQCRKGINIVDELDKYLMMKKSNKVNDSLDKLKKVDDIIKGEYKDLELLNTLLYPVFFTIMSQHKAKTNNEIIEKNKFLYESMLKKVEYAINKIKKSLKNIGNMEM